MRNTGANSSGPSYTLLNIKFVCAAEGECLWRHNSDSSPERPNRRAAGAGTEGVQMVSTHVAYPHCMHILT